MTPEATRILSFLASVPRGHSTIKEKDLEELLMDTGGNVLCRGSLMDIQTKPLGAGVCKIWTTPFDYEAAI